MQKEKLKKFTAFVRSMIPHEAAYLKLRLNTKDDERQLIMNHVFHNVMNTEQFTPFDIEIDKRKYSKLLTWMQVELDKIDVDKNLKWISKTHESILLDEISPALDAQIMRSIKRYSPHEYYFLRFYEMLIEYRHYLLIRMRYNGHQKINEFLEKHHFDYQRSKLVYDQMHQATSDIIGTGNTLQKEAIQWKRWLYDSYKDSTLDGLNRYMAAIRYIFVCLRYNSMDDLEDILLSLDSFFKNGSNYSKRILVNYYDNMLVLFDKKGDYEKAKYYGYLSIKHQHPDAIIYRNNLVNVLIKNQEFDEALNVIEEAEFKTKSTRNFHSVIGFVSNHVRCLTKVGRVSEAVTKGRVFLNAYDNNILKYRWHRFFAAYHGALLTAGKHHEIIKNTEKYDLAQKEWVNYNKKHSQKILNIYYQIALHQSPKEQSAAFREIMNQLITPDQTSQYDTELLEIIEEMSV